MISMSDHESIGLEGVCAVVESPPLGDGAEEEAADCPEEVCADGQRDNEPMDEESGAESKGEDDGDSEQGRDAGQDGVSEDREPDIAADLEAGVAADREAGVPTDLEAGVAADLEAGESSNVEEAVAVPEDSANGQADQVGTDDQLDENNRVRLPPIPNDFCPTQMRRQRGELPQRGPLHSGKAAHRECGRYGRSLRPSEEECLKRAKRYAMEQSVKFVLQRQQQQQQKQQLDYVKKQQALMLMCRVYVGSIYYEVREDAVRTAFAPFGPIRSVSMTYDNMTNKHKGFAFIEYELPDAAQLALAQMNNAVLGGRNIKVGRPSNMPQAQPIINQLTEESKNYNRVYVSSVHPGLSEQDVKCVFEAFGKVCDCTLCRETPPGMPSLPPGAHRGYGFVDYEEASSANDAIASMNLFDLGGQLLRVGRAITPPEGLLPQSGFPGGQPPPTISGGSFPTASAIAAANVTAKLQAYDVERSPVSSLSAINAQQMIDQAAVTGTVLPALMPANVPIVRPPATIIVPPVVCHEPTGQQASEEKRLEPIEACIPNQVETQKEPEVYVPDTSFIPPVEVVCEDKKVSPASPMTPTLTEDQKTLLGITDDSIIGLTDEPTVKGREQRRLLMRKLMERQPRSRVMLMRNMVEPDEVDDDLETDINEECSKYGVVTKVVISEERRTVDDEQNESVVIKIFVEFEEAESVQKAIDAIDGRWFAGRTVKADSYDQNLFDMGDYTA